MGDEGWIDTGRSQGRARLVAALRHPALILRRRRRGVRSPAPVPISRAEVLERLCELPVSTWTYGWEHESVKHMGPMAQDFAQAFGLGDSDRRIHTVDADGVLMASVQALHERIVAAEAQIRRLEAER